MKLWSYPRINIRTLVPIRGFEAQKSESALRTCVYSRYAELKTAFYRGFHRSRASPGLAVDYRQNNQEQSFLRRKGDATLQTLSKQKPPILWILRISAHRRQVSLWVPLRVAGKTRDSASRLRTDEQIGPRSTPGGPRGTARRYSLGEQPEQQSVQCDCCGHECRGVQKDHRLRGEQRH